MARKRVAPFEPPTEQEFTTLGPDRVRRGPRGGFVWLCDTEGCRQPASHLSQAGRKVCRTHGGSTAASRDPVVQAVRAAEGKPVQVHAGRPVTHGFYSVLEGQRVDELVAEYRARKLDPDSTDDDMYYLRALLDDLRQHRPDSEVLAGLLKEAIKSVQEFKRMSTDEVSETGRKLNVQQVLSFMGLTHELAMSVDTLKDTLKATIALTAGIEERHANLITLAKIRAETRLKNSAAAQLDAFTVMVQRLVRINAETLPSAQAEALSLRYARELNALPAGGIKVKVQGGA